MTLNCIWCQICP